MRQPKRKMAWFNWNIASNPNPIQTKSLKSKVDCSSLLVIVKSFLSTFLNKLQRFFVDFSCTSTRMPGPIVDLAIPPDGRFSTKEELQVGQAVVLYRSMIGKQRRKQQSIWTSWWFWTNPFEKYAQVKLDHFPSFPPGKGNNKKYVSCHHLVKTGDVTTNGKLVAWLGGRLGIQGVVTLRIPIPFIRGLRGIH